MIPDKVMINSIEWHLGNIKNQERSLSHDQERLIALRDKVARDQASLDFYKMQVRMAKQAGKEKFDRERFAVKKK